MKRIHVVELQPLPGSTRPRIARFSEKGLELLERAGAQFVVIGDEPVEDDGLATVRREAVPA